MTGFTLDHLGIAVADLDDAAAQYRRLGFQLTDRGYHTLPPPRLGADRPFVGTGNHCAMLQQGYLELIGVTDPAYRGRLNADIARYQGIHIVAFGVDDSAAVARSFAAAGFGTASPQILERPVETQGETAVARFEIVDIPDRIVPEGHFFAIHHTTPELLWRPALMSHPNGAVKLTSLTVAVADPSDFARRLGHALSATAIGDDGFRLTLSAGQVRIVDSSWVATHVSTSTPALPYIAGVTLQVADLARTSSLLEKNGIPNRCSNGSLVVGPGQACGAFIEFQAKA
jgi:catechol 2,3-dioxygenase-like lactoylglutathione lyase family enzyme